MKPKRDQGMTLLEVVIALTILMIGVGFLMQSDKVAYRYRHERELRQQMLFYAAGQVEAYIEGQTVKADFPPFNNLQAEVNVIKSAENNQHLQKVQVKVYVKNSPNDPEPVTLYTYRVAK